METENFRKIITGVLIIALLVLCFFIIKPIFISILFGFILAFIFYPVYNIIFKITKAKNFSAALICLLLIVIFVLPLWYFTPLIINQAFKLYLFAQQIDYVSVIKQIFPSTFGSEQFATEIGGMIKSFIIKGGNSVLDSLSKIILNAPTLLLHLVVVVFVFFFALRDKKELLQYLKSLSPFATEINDKLFKSSKDITISVLYGTVIIGAMQGVVLGIGFFLFGVPNALILSVLGIIVGVLPILGPMIVWIPVLIYLLVINASITTILGILIFGIFSSNMEHIFRPILIAKYSQLHSAIVLIGMIGGVFLFGVLGLILGPLILAYLIIILDVYRETENKKLGIRHLIKRD
jgi:predicted PurR-regulated permease PerM